MCSLKLCIFSTARVNHPSGRSMKIMSLKNPHRKRLRDVGNTARGCSLWGESNWEVENSIIFDTLPRGKPSELDQCHWMTSGKDWQLPKQSCYSSWHTGYPSSLLKKLRTKASSEQGQVLHEESNSTSWKRYLSCLNHTWHWDVILF